MTSNNITIKGMAVRVEIVRANGEKSAETIVCETCNETAAVNLALDAAVAAYPGAKEIRWTECWNTHGTITVDGRGPVFGTWFIAL